MYIPLHCAHKLYHRIGYNLQITDNRISTYKATTTLPSEHSTPNQLQGSTDTSSSIQFDKAPKGSLTIRCLNFKRALPAHTHTNHVWASIFLVATTRFHKLKIPPLLVKYLLHLKNNTTPISEARKKLPQSEKL